MAGPGICRIPANPFVIGILGKDPFGPDLDAVVRGETVAQPSPAGRALPTTSASCITATFCFIGRTEIGRVCPTSWSALKGRSILTVTDAEDGDPAGVMIQAGHPEQPDPAANRCGRRQGRQPRPISSKLLRPAEIVGEEG